MFKEKNTKIEKNSWDEYFHFLLRNVSDYFENSLKLDTLTYVLLYISYCAKHHIGQIRYSNKSLFNICLPH